MRHHFVSRWCDVREQTASCQSKLARAAVSESSDKWAIIFECSAFVASFITAHSGPDLADLANCMAKTNQLMAQDCLVVVDAFFSAAVPMRNRAGTSVAPADATAGLNRDSLADGSASTR
jgi:hypothetical protein